MRFPLRRRRWILCSANNGVGIVMSRPILDRLRFDARVRIFHTAMLSHTRQFDDADRDDIRNFFHKHNVRSGVLHFRVSRFMPWEVYLSPNFSQRIVPRFARTKVQIFHGVSFKNCAVNPRSVGFDQLFLPGPYHRQRFIDKRIVEEGDPKLLMIGLPKVDRLVDGSLDRTQILIDHHLDPTLPTVLFAPTGDPGNSLNRMGQEIIQTLLELPINLIVKPHDHASEDAACQIDWKEKLRTWQHPQLSTDLGSDVVPLLFAADLLVTDASSVAFEYALLDRPIIFMDVPEIINGPRAQKMDLETWGRKGGDLLEDPAGLRKLVPHLLENPEQKSEIRRAIAADLFYKPGTATARAVRQLYENMDLDPPPEVVEVEKATAG